VKSFLQYENNSANKIKIYYHQDNTRAQVTILHM